MILEVVDEKNETVAYTVSCSYGCEMPTYWTERRAAQADRMHEMTHNDSWNDDYWSNDD